MSVERTTVGIWSEIPPSSRWANEGIHRVLGFTVEGAAVDGVYRFVVCVPTGMAETVREDFRQLAATEGKDWDVVEPPPGFRPIIGARARAMGLQLGISDAAIRQAMFANAHVDVEAWIVSFPHFTGALLLDAPRTTLLPDAIPFDFPIGWGAGAWAENAGWDAWRKNAGRALRLSGSVVAHSQHVATQHGVQLLGCSPDQIVVNPHPPPDLLPLTVASSDRRRTSESRATAANLLRFEATQRSWSYLSDFPFEDVDYIAVSTQDRPTKNLYAVGEAVRRLVRRDHANYKLFTTARFQDSSEWSLFPSLLRTENLETDIVSLPDLPRPAHAALYHCATVTVHPAFYEGIIGSLAFFESISVGTPCLLARGPHVAEFLETEPDLYPWTFDPYDIDALTTLVHEVGRRRDEIVGLQLEIYTRIARRGWNVAARTYCEAALSARRPVFGMQTII
jgi:glycosyltransferase involved in cell wall biosynthesis